MRLLISQGLATFLIILAIIVVGAAAFLLYFFVFSRNSYKKQLKEFERKYSYLDALLIGQDSQYIHRLEIISRTNLLFVDKHSEYSRRFKQILDGDDKFCESMIKQLRALIANKQYKNIKAVISDTRAAIATFEENANQLDQELYSIIKPEEEARHTVLKLKEDYRRVKQIFYANSNDLELIASSFTRVFEKLDSYFTNFETAIESGEYEEANSLVKVIEKVIVSVDKILAEAPNLCILLEKIVPEKISALQNEYEGVEKQGVPLFNLSFRKKLDDWNNRLVVLRNQMVNLRITGVRTELDNIQNEIEAFRSSLGQEIDDKDDFNLNCDDIYQKVVNLEKVFVKICSILPEVREYYIVSEEQENQIKKLGESINQLGNAKRTLDNFIHSATKQPYSLLKIKLDELKHDYDIANEGVNDFKAYLDSLKTSSEDAYTMIFVYYYHCKQIEKMLREMDIPSFSEKCEPEIENCYTLLNEIDIVIKQKPINVAAVNDMVEQLKNVANSFFDEVENKYREQQLAESAIVYANRDRSHQSNVHQQLSILENLFFEGEFAKVYHDATNIYKRVHAEENDDSKK